MLLLILACTAPRPAPDVFLISLDTVRADAISAWQLPPAGRAPPPASITPNLDALAASGRRYAWAFAHAPSTLASHATVFTGLDPHQLAIPRNGFPLLAGPSTLAEVLTARGYRCHGVLGSTALARPMGVDRGFETWDETFSVSRRKRHEATATEVTDRALAALADADAPVFLFAHYFDAHGPYQAPAPYAGRYNPSGLMTEQRITAAADACRGGRCADPDVRTEVDHIRAAYLEEVAYLDAEVGRLLATPVRANGRVVVVFADHGEMLGESTLRPFGHGADVDPPATHVPLIIAGSGIVPEVVNSTVGLRDVRGLLLATLGDEAPQLRPVPMEATQPGGPPPSWNNRRNERGWVEGERYLITSPWEGIGPRTYTRDGQPLPDDPALAEALLAWDAQQGGFRSVTMSDATTEGLRALGYLD